MRKFYLFALLLLGSFGLYAQSNGLSVYKVMQDHCISCHSNGSPSAGLDLEGSGSTDAQRWATVYNNIVDISPANAVAAAEGDTYVYPGRPDRSYLFNKLNNGLEPSLSLGAGEGDPMPFNENTTMSDYEKEIIRQWILFGAKQNGNQFDEERIANYYNIGGVEAFPDGPPPAPAAEEGFQIKMGPFFLKEGGQPGDELEFFQKYQLNLPDDTEVIGLDHLFSGSSHHFIVYKYNTPEASNSIPDGLRLESYHDDINLVTAVQEKIRIDLPVGSAFSWNKDDMLDLNSHYINYSVGEVYKAEAYLNVYTQTKGTAAQEMKTELIPNLSIFVPNNESLVTVTQPIWANGLGDIHIWGLMGHTHKYGKDYKVWLRENGDKGELVYDASCAQAVPGCIAPNFDYQHIPLRLYEPFLEVNMDNPSGLIHEASWVNDGPEPLFFGVTSDDEMMVLIMMYLEDIEGVVATQEPALPQASIEVYPNPMQEYTEFIGQDITGKSELRLLDALGRSIHFEKNDSPYFRMSRGQILPGIYFYEINTEGYAPVTGKLLIQ